MTDPSKIKETHTQRAAFIYLRQSTPAQVAEEPAIPAIPAHGA